VFPPAAVVVDAAGHEMVVPGYYVAAAYAGLQSALPPQTPTSNVALAGFKRLMFSNTYFRDEHLRTIESAGCSIFIQRGEGGAIVCRHQLTNDITSLETREQNIIKSVDAFARRLRNGLASFAGRFLINANTLATLNYYIQGYIASAVADGLLVEVTLSKLEQKITAKDEVYIELQVIPFYPCNVIDVHLYI
jgi:hypothetical protein